MFYSGTDDASIQQTGCKSDSSSCTEDLMKAIFTTGNKAAALYEVSSFPNGYLAFVLPSTSPANCRMTYDDLKQAYAVILPYFLR